MTYTEDDVERVAKAICCGVGRCIRPNDCWGVREGHRHGTQHSKMAEARAALAAMPDGREAVIEECAKVSETMAANIRRLHGEQFYHVKIGSLLMCCDEIAQNIRALKAQPAATGWQPIETAPKDRSFWGWHPEWGSPEICRWEGRSFKPDTIIERLERTGSSGWYSGPSHWHPRWDVPTPPSEGSGE